MKKVEIIKYRTENMEMWDNFVKESRNGTIFHTQKFINYHPKDRFEDYYLKKMRN